MVSIYLLSTLSLFPLMLSHSPGRFFAVSELKAMLAFVLQNYDVKLCKPARPQNQWLQGHCSPNKKAELFFRKRAS